MKIYKIPYQYTIVGTAHVMAESLEEAVEAVEYDADCPTPPDFEYFEGQSQIKKVNLSYLNESFEIYHDDLDILND